MLFYIIIIVSLQIQLVFSHLYNFSVSSLWNNLPDIGNDNDPHILKIKSVVNDFQNYNYPAEIKKQPTEFIAFENNLLIIIQQMKYLFNEMDKTDKTDKMDKTELTDYISQVCSLLPTCLDYNLIGNSLNKKLVMLNKIYISLCHSSFMNNSQSNTDDSNKKHLIEEVKQLLLPFSFLAEVETGIKQNLLTKADYMEKSKNFITEIHDHIINIDMISFMIKNKRKLYENILDNDSHGFELVRKPLRPINLIHTPDFLSVNRKYEPLFENYCGVKITGFDKGYSISFKAMSGILLTAIGQFIYYASYRINNGLITSEFNDVPSMENGYADYMAKGRKIICKKGPMILWYLSESNGMAPNLETYSMYFALCGNFREYVNNIRCSDAFIDSNIYEEAKTNCVQKSAKTIWTWNIYSIFKQVPMGYLPSGTCLNYSLDYLNEIYDEINAYYKFEPEAIPRYVWTHFEWLSAQQFITRDFNNIELKELRSKEIIIKDVKMNLLMAFNTILPWSLNMPTLLTFYNTIVYHLARTMDMYIFRHAKIVKSYMESINKNLDKQLTTRICESALLYNYEREHFLDHLLVPFRTTFSFKLYEPKRYRQIDRLVITLTSLRSKTFINISDYISEEDNQNLMKWYYTVLPNKPQSHQFDAVLKEHCKNVIGFLSEFYSIVKKFMKTQSEYDAEGMIKKYCKNVFQV